MAQINLFTKQKQIHGLSEETCGGQREEWEEEMESLGWTCTQCYI